MIWRRRYYNPFRQKMGLKLCDFKQQPLQTLVMSCGLITKELFKVLVNYFWNAIYDVRFEETTPKEMLETKI